MTTVQGPDHIAQLLVKFIFTCISCTPDFVQHGTSAREPACPIIQTLAEQKRLLLQHLRLTWPRCVSRVLARYSELTSALVHARLSRSLQGGFLASKVSPSLSSDTTRCRGEQTASALESRLTDVERRIDQLLASVQESTHQVEHHHPDHLPKENDNSSKDAERQ